MPKGQLTYKGLVYPWHCDHMGHMNVMWYVGKYDEATWALFEAIGLNSNWLRSSDKGMAALQQNIAYKREALAGDTLEIYSRPIEIKERTIRFVHEMIDCKSGETASTCEIIGAHLDTKARKAIAFPDDVREKTRALIAKLGDA
jgi:acyl-CoA thioester hydrolase